MKKLLLTFFIFSLSTFAAQDGLSEARELGERGIIVNQSTMAAPYAGDSNIGTLQEASMYRLSDSLVRQEALGTALKLKGVTLSDYYMCHNYFRDTAEWWVCRAAEMAADYGLVTRANLYFRPHDTLTLAESLGITMNSLGISLSTTSTATVPGNIPAWQKRLILTLEEQEIPLNVRDDNGTIIALSDTRIGSGYDMSHRLTRGQFFQVVVALLHYSENQNPLAHCTVYNDGCNDCTSNMETTQCTERQCFWKGIPSCSACEDGYMVENGRCVKKPTACVGLGGVVSNFSLPPEYQTSGTCCSGLTSVGTKEPGIVGSPNICANIGDGYCDSRYESSYNSSDCPTSTTFDSSICQSYYDGCNSCSRTSDGQTMCTMMACFVNGPAYCTSYVSYTPVSQSQDATFLEKIKKEITSYTSDQSCTDNDQCKWKLFGSNSCGGWNSAIGYSSKNVNETLLSNKVTYYTQTEEQYNQNYGIVGTCVYLQSPHPRGCSASGFCTP